MATNADEETTQVVDNAADDSPVTEDDLRNLKYGEDGVETSQEADEPDEADEAEENAEDSTEEGKTDDQAEETEETEDNTEVSFVKEFPHIKGDTPEEYAKNLEIAYQNSTKEALRLKGLAETTQGKDEAEDDTTTDVSDVTQLYAKQKMDEEIMSAYTDFSTQYNQVNDPVEYDRFKRKVSVLSRTILEDEKRLAPPAELYRSAAVLLGWESQTAPSEEDKLKAAVKDSAATSKTTSSATKKKSVSKVTDAMVAANRKMYPNKTDAEIREELEPYVN